MSEPRVILSGLAYVESPRWHDGRLSFAHWGTDEIIAVDLDGNNAGLRQIDLWGLRTSVTPMRTPREVEWMGVPSG